ncbi:inositol polyphosphate-4-phosphatase type I A-like, partial [Pollicipes pollicipes]|uniref:inositol polyphosphate-4-phosphatase type I A-like n=1 Tax=Pollicipes pollicipes TaxID=41117 RepID=UPI001884AC8E
MPSGMDTKPDQLLSLFVQPWSKTYKFSCKDASELVAKETMAESQYSFRIPASLIELLMEDENQLLDEMKQLDALAPPYCTLVQEAVVRHEGLLLSYSRARETLKTHSGPFFKHSTLKGDASLEFVPVNLHVQRLRAEAQGSGRTLTHDVITVGAFTAFSQRFRDGGLLQLVERLSGPRAAVDPGKTSAVYQAESVVQGIEDARNRILEASVDLLESVEHDDTTMVPALMEIVTKESGRVACALRSPVVEDACRFLAAQRADGAAPALDSLLPPPPSGRAASFGPAPASSADGATSWS